MSSFVVIRENTESKTCEEIQDCNDNIETLVNMFPPDNNLGIRNNIYFSEKNVFSIYQID